MSYPAQASRHLEHRGARIDQVGKEAAVGGVFSADEKAYAYGVTRIVGTLYVVEGVR